MKGNDAQTKVHYKGKDNDFIIFVDSSDAVKEWKKDSSVPLAQVVSGWKIFHTNKYVDHTPASLIAVRNSVLTSPQAGQPGNPRRCEQPGAGERVRHEQGGGCRKGYSGEG